MKDLENIKEVVEQAKNGSEKDRDAILKWYYPLVKILARKYKVANVLEDDAVSVGWIALNKAIDSYKSDSKASFQTFASLCIRNAIYDENRKAKNYYDNINTIDTNDDNSNDDQQDAVENLFNDNSNPEDIAQDKLLEKLIMNELKKLFSEDELLIIKYYLMNQSAKEIAEELQQTKDKIDKTIRKYKKKIDEIKRRLNK